MRKIFILIFSVFIVSGAFCQFYNGHQMDFGKNRVQYDDNFWQYYRFQRFDTYFYVGGNELAAYAGQFAEKKIPELERFFEFNLESRIIFIIYNKLSDFRQSNIGLATGNNQYNIGGVTRIIDNKVFLYFEGDYKEFEKQISASIAEVMLNKMLYGNDFKNKVANSTLLSLPDWFIKGLISYASENWSVEIENKVKDGILSGKYERFNGLTGEDAIYAGHSIWNYIANTYGKSTIPNILYLTKINKNVENGFLYVLGTSLKYLSFDWLNYYDTKYYEPNKAMNTPDESLLKKVKKNRVYSQAKMNPEGNKIAYVTNEYGQYKVWLYDVTTGKSKKILKKEHKLDQVTDYSFPVIAWHPRGEILSIISEYKGKLTLFNYILSENRFETKLMTYFEKILDFSYSKNGLEMVISGIQNGKTDIFVHNIAANANIQITNDFYDDLNPSFIEDSKKIIFSSNRIVDTLVPVEKFKKYSPLSNQYDLFIYNYETKSNKLIRLTDTKYSNEIQPFEFKKNHFIVLSDENGIYNRHIFKFDSTISFIDTSTHYRYFSTSKPLTNYSRNIIEQNYSSFNHKTIDVLFVKGKYPIIPQTLIDGLKPIESLKITDYKKISNRESAKKDSLLLIPPVIKKDSVPNKSQADKNKIDINNYIFETEKKKSDSLIVKNDTSSFNLPSQSVYFTSFYTNYFVNQIDFGFLNSSYQAFTGSAFYFNPGVNLFLKIGTNDLFEDYKITGGFRFSGNFNSNEYLLSFENLKKRLDKQILFHRQAFTNVSTSIMSKTHTHELMYILNYPFSQISAIKTTLSGRYDRIAFLSTDLQSLYKLNEYKVWTGSKVEYIYDNTRSLGLNLYTGTRFKLFGEFYKQVNEKKSELFVLGADFRHYEKIHKTIIWASRFAASSSFGSSRLIYYLGGVDNWVNLSTKHATFDQSIPIDDKHNYVYQTVATNMRGFSQNIRNGNSFALINNEIRIPIVRYFSNRPINSDFLANLQIIGFSDIGAAWTGWSPYSKDNAYNTETIQNGSVTVIIDKNRPPFVYGYGFGVRSRLLGYFVRCDWAWGVEGNVVLPKMFYLSLCLDF